MNQKISTGIGTIILTIFFITASVFVWKYYNLNPILDVSIPAPSGKIKTVCTMEVKLCPDGSSVSRGGPNCEFAACPQKEGYYIDYYNGDDAYSTCDLNYLEEKTKELNQIFFENS